MDLRIKNPTRVALAGGLCLVVAWTGLAGPLNVALFPGGVALLLLAGVSWIVKPQKRTSYWRGREIDMSDTLGWWERLYYRIYRE